MDFEERSTHVYRQKRMFTKEELESREGLCINEQPAYCVAACPLKSDPKEMIRCISEGNFTKARQIYEKTVLFPHIMASACEAPCMQKCKLSEMGDAVQVRDLEMAAVKYGEKAKTKGMLRFKKKQTVCICGSDLFTLFLSGELSRKNYPLTIYCREDSLEAFFEACMKQVPGDKEFLKMDLDYLKAQDIRFVFSDQATAQEIENRKEEYDVFCISAEVSERLYPGTQPDERYMVCYDTKCITAKKTDRVLLAAFSAKKAAVTVDRLAQKLSPDNSRGEEGAQETHLITNIEGVQPLPAVICGAEGYSKDEAAEEAKRCILCHCDECMKGCAYLQHYGKFPKVLTREIYNNVSIIMGDHMMNKVINACSLCGQCTVTCPNGYDMSQVCHIARQNMVTTGKMPLAPHEFALYDMLFSNQEAFLCKKQPGFETCKYVFFPGCQAVAIAPDTVKAAYLDLCSRLDGGVGLILGCCGAICDWAGRYEMYEETVNFIDEKWKELGCPEVIAGCPTCKKELSAHGTMHVRGIWDILLEYGVPDAPKSQEKDFALHDSCGAREDEQTRTAIRTLIKSMGIEVEETPYSGEASPCCGYGGLVSYANREVAKKMTDQCLERSNLPYITYCMACRDRFARDGRKTKHILELVYGVSAFEAPDISEKRYHRLTLKNQLLESLWGEEIKPVELGFEIEYTPEALELMDDRMILKSDVEEVMKSVRENAEAILDEETGLLVSRKRLGNVTFWVKYKETQNGYQVFRAYSHRMNVEKRLG